MPGSTWSRKLSGLSVLLLLTLSAVPARGQIRLDLPAQSLAQSLTAVGTLGHLNVMFDPSIVDGLRAPALKAELSADDALGRLLSGTKLHAVRVDANTVRVVAEPASKHAQTGGATETGATYPAANVRFASAGAPLDSSIDATDQSGSQLAGSGQIDSGKKTEDKELAQVVVTGTHIRGAPQASPVTQITRRDIAASGYSTTAQLFETLPQNFNIGGPNYSAAQGQSGQGYEPGASRPNLRGLGDATLVLINGHRVAQTGLGNSYDVSTIPLTAIDRIEIVTDNDPARRYAL